MRFTFLSAALSALVFANAQSVGSTPGYNDGSISSTVAGNETLNFGSHFAILNLDFVNAIVSFVNSTDEGQQFLDCVKTWVDAANALPEKPLTIYTRVYFSNQFRPEIGPNAPFAETVAPLGNVTEEDAASEIYPAFEVQEDRGDVVLQKTRIYAGVNNGLELILRTQGIDTVILSGIRTSGSVLSTVYRLFDLDYNVYVIANNTIETPPDTPGLYRAALEGMIPKLGANVITLEQAIAALERSGPATWGT